MVGTPYYIAPEVIMSKHGPSCDVWSIGVLLYIMLSGFLPFTGESPNKAFAKIIKGSYKMDQTEWSYISEESKDLIKQMLIVDPVLRITADDALNHSWFNPGEASTD